MPAQVINLGTERKCRALASALAKAEAAVAGVQADLAANREALEDLGLDPRAREILQTLKLYFNWSSLAGADLIIREIDYLADLLRGYGRPEE